MLVAESEGKKHEKERVLNESYPPLKLSGLSVEELQVLAEQIIPIQPLLFYVILTVGLIFLYRIFAKTYIIRLML